MMLDGCRIADHITGRRIDEARPVAAPRDSKALVTALSLVLRPERPIALDGGVIHGALGAALHDVSPEAYAAIYDAPIPPYRMAWLAPQLRVCLFGPATRYAIALAQAVFVMGQRGLGNARVVARIESIHQNHGRNGLRELSRSGQWSGLPEPVPLGDLVMDRYPDANWSLRLDTPLALKRGDRVSRDVPHFAVLLSRSIERCARILALGAEFPFVASDVRRSGQEVPVLASKVQWSEFERYSTRQKRAMPIGGIRGVVHYGPAPAQALAWIDACSWLGLGGKTTFGLGDIRVTSTI